MKTLSQKDFTNKRAVIRVDFNVPLDENFKVTDNTRIIAAKETIELVLEGGGSCVLISHLGRPKGKDAQFSLSHILEEVKQILNIPVEFCEDCVGPKAEKATEDLKPGSVILMENLRYYSEETAGDVDFASQLSKLGDCYINDAFGTAHRAHASTTIIAQFFKEEK
ncbi:MAG: phosphoglycerate kinase, partial [Flavobacteriales bacterium]